MLYLMLYQLLVLNACNGEIAECEVDCESGVHAVVEASKLLNVFPGAKSVRVKAGSHLVAEFGLSVVAGTSAHRRAPRSVEPSAACGRLPQGDACRG